MVLESDMMVKINPVTTPAMVLASESVESKLTSAEKAKTVESKLTSAEKAKTVSQQATINSEPWDPNEFMKDAEYFATTFGLPNPSDGLNPLKITDITEEMLSGVFGKKERNGYKLINCTGLPTEDMIELSKVVDGYDKPVNNVLSHSFVKGVYAERILRKKVNWAAYAAAKLKGQITQYHREKKGRPDGPPYVRKPRQYKPPLPELREMATGSGQQQPDSNPVEPLVSNSKDLVVFEEQPPEVMGPISLVNESTSPLKESRWLSAPTGEKPPPNLLLSLLRQSMSTTAANERQLSRQIDNIQDTLVTLHKTELDQPRLRLQLQSEVEKAQAEFSKLAKEIESTDADIETLVSDVELEGNKEEGSEGSQEFLNLFEYRLEAKRRHLDDLHCRQETVQRDTQTLKTLLAAKEKSFLLLPKKETRAKNLLSVLEKDLKAIRSARDAQAVEHEILAAVLDTPPPTLIPRFVPTSTRTVGTQISLTSCPVCCNGYHCYNWIPASCGHTYHPACLFSLISKSPQDPKCHSCGESVSHDWLRSWGLEHSASDSIGKRAKSYVDEMRDVYGKHSDRLGRRRELAAQIQTVQERGDGQSENDLPYHSSLGGSLIDLGEDPDHGSTKSKLLTPKTENGKGGSKRKTEPEETEARKVNQRVLSSSELQTLPFTPENITKISFKSLLAIVGTGSAERQRETQPGDVVTEGKKSQKKLILRG